MGMQHCHQAIPDDSRLLRAARNPQHWERGDREAIQFYESYLRTLNEKGQLYFRSEKRPPDTPFDKLLRSEVEAIWTADPTIADRRIELYKFNCYDDTHFLLGCAFPDADRWDQSGPIFRAIYGGPGLSDLVATQGHRIRYLSPADVVPVYEFLDSIDYDQLHKRWDFSDKTYGKLSYLDDEYLRFLASKLKDLRDFFETVLNANEGVLTVID